MNLEAYGQDPKLVYKKQGYELFEMMIEKIEENVTETLFGAQGPSQAEIGAMRQKRLEEEQAHAWSWSNGGLKERRVSERSSIKVGPLSARWSRSAATRPARVAAVRSLRTAITVEKMSSLRSSREATTCLGVAHEDVSGHLCAPKDADRAGRDDWKL